MSAAAVTTAWGVWAELEFASARRRLLSAALIGAGSCGLGSPLIGSGFYGQSVLRGVRSRDVGRGAQARLPFVFSGRPRPRDPCSRLSEAPVEDAGFSVRGIRFLSDAADAFDGGGADRTFDLHLAAFTGRAVGGGFFHRWRSGGGDLPGA